MSRELVTKVKCVNRQCPHYDKAKVVKHQYLGDGLYLRAAIICGCGFDVRLVSEDEDRVGRVAAG